MSAFIDAARSARRMQLYARLRRAETEGLRARVVSALISWGTPVAAPALALLAVAVGRDGALFEVGAALAMTALTAHLLGRPRLRAFDLLHQPSRRGLVLGHVLRRLPPHLWAGALTALTWLVLMPWLPHSVAGSLLLGTVALAPLALGLSAGAGRVEVRAGRPRGATLLPFLLVLVGAQAAEFWLEAAPWKWLLPVAGGAVGLAIARRAGGLLTMLRTTCALALLVLVITVPSAPGGPAFHGETMAWLGAAAGAAAVCLTVLCLALRAQLVLVELAEVAETSADGDAPDARRVPLHVPLRLERVGSGLWRARLHYAADVSLPEARPAGSTWRTMSDWLGVVPFATATVLRGPVLAALAVVLARDYAAPLWLAVLAGCLAQRTGAVDRIELQPRLWLLGVDYRDQVLHGLRSLLLCAALPTLAGALGALAIAGPGDPARQAVVMVIAGTLLLRAGLPGLWPLQETHRLRLVFAWAAIVGLALAHAPWWPALGAARAAAGLGAAGLVLLGVRLLRLREPRLRDCVRTAEEP